MRNRREPLPIYVGRSPSSRRYSQSTSRECSRTDRSSVEASPAALLQLSNQVEVHQKYAEQLKKADNLKPIAKIHVAKNGRYLHALAADGSIVYHFPTTVGSEYDPRSIVANHEDRASH